MNSDYVYLFDPSIQKKSTGYKISLQLPKLQIVMQSLRHNDKDQLLSKKNCMTVMPVCF